MKIKWFYGVTIFAVEFAMVVLFIYHNMVHREVQRCCAEKSSMLTVRMKTVSVCLSCTDAKLIDRTFACQVDDESAHTPDSPVTIRYE